MAVSGFPLGQLLLAARGRHGDRAPEGHLVIRPAEV